MVDKEGKKEYDRRTKEKDEANWKERSLHGEFPKSSAEFANSVLWQWLRSGFKNKTEAVITDAQDQALRTNWLKSNIDGVDFSCLCKVSQCVVKSSIYIAS